MKISGLQKLTALDYPGLIACTVFTPGCNFRCGFCHNAALVTAGSVPEDIPLDEVMAYLRSRRGLLDGVVISGGEPLMQPGLGDFAEKIKALGYRVKLDTNGSYPERLKELIDSALVDYVAMDIKNSPAKYALTCGAESVDMDKIHRSIEIIMTSAPDYEFRTTAVKELHSDADFEAMGELIRGAKAWYIQNFVDSGGLIAGGLSAPAVDTMRRWAGIAANFVQNVEIRGI